MPNEQLYAYIRECYSRGFTKEEIENALIAVGWNSDEISVALRELAGGVEPIALASSDPAASPNEVSAKENLPVPTFRSFSGNTNEAQGEESLSLGGATESFYSELEFTSEKSSKMKKFAALLIGIVVFAVVAGSAAGYFVLMRNTTPSPLAEVALMQEAMKSVHSYAFDSRVALELTGGSAQYAQPSEGSPTEGSLKLAFTATGTVNIGTTAPERQMNVAYNMDGNANYAAVSFVLDGGVDVRVVGGKLYLRIVKVPKALAMLGVSDNIAEWKDKWIVVDGSSTELLNPKVASTLGGAEDSTTTSMYRSKAAAIVKKDWPLILTVPKEDPTRVAGVETYHYQFTVDKEKLGTLVRDLVELYPSDQRTVDPQATTQSINLLSSIFASTTGDLYIGKSDSYLYRTDLHMPVHVATSSTNIDGSIDIELQSSQFNAVPPLTAPTDATPASDVSRSMTSEEQNGFAFLGASTSSMSSKENIRDTRRVSDIESIQLGLGHYFGAHQKYPEALNLLVKERDIPSMPLDPLDHTLYSYQQLQNGKSYALGASLETTENTVPVFDDKGKQSGSRSVLDNDADQKLTDFQTADAKGCKGEVDRHCYDVKP